MNIDTGIEGVEEAEHEEKQKGMLEVRGATGGDADDRWTTYRQSDPRGRKFEVAVASRYRRARQGGPAIGADDLL